METNTLELVKQLREKTGAPMGDCKLAIQEAGDVAKAEEWLRAKGKLNAGRREGKVASEGRIHSYIHGDGKIGVMLEVNCETDFVGKSEQFKNFCKDVSLHIAAHNPRFVAPLRTDPAFAEAYAAEEKFQVRMLDDPSFTKKPEAVRTKILEGKMNKWVADVCLMNQPFVKDPAKNITELLGELVGKVGEKVEVRRFTRYVLGEGIMKQTTDFAQDVMSLVDPSPKHDQYKDSHKGA